MLADHGLTTEKAQFLFAVHMYILALERDRAVRNYSTLLELTDDAFASLYMTKISTISLTLFD